MAYLTLTFSGEEYERRELRAGDALVIGRAPDCDIAIRDIILSRHHCRVERTEDNAAWRIVDLHSKNGTHLRGQAIESHVLRVPASRYLPVDADGIPLGPPAPTQDT